MLTIDGKRAPINDAERVKFNRTFYPGINRNTRKQTGNWRGMVYHWTGAENPAHRMINNLIRNNLSIHFTCDPDGSLTQEADTDTICAHAGIANSGFMGLEAVCRGFASQADMSRADQKSTREKTELDWKTPRDLYRDTIGGRAINMAGFNPAQLRSMLWLAETMAGLIGFDRMIPYTKATKATISAMLPVNGDDFVISFKGENYIPCFSRNLRTAASLQKFSGILGHFHCHTTKKDPGTQVFYQLWVEGWNPASQKLPGLAPIYYQEK